MLSHRLSQFCTAFLRENSTAAFGKRQCFKAMSANEKATARA
jgi:hypothetical protein